ncbi:MAG: ATP-binding protein [Candidatus Kapaibacteriota bacterium]
MNRRVKLEVQKEFTSDKKVITEIENLLKSIQKEVPFDSKKFHNILVASTEAVMNAIQHGNRYNPRKKVVFKVIAETNKIIVSVADEGEGFDPSTLEDPRTPENILKERGRGIFIIRELSDKTSITTSKNGTIIRMEFNIK